MGRQRKKEKGGRKESVSGQRGRVPPAAWSPHVPLETLGSLGKGGDFTGVLASPAG